MEAVWGHSVESFPIGDTALKVSNQAFEQCYHERLLPDWNAPLNHPVGKPGDIHWEQLVPDILANEPSTDYQCDWQVDDDPEGTVCLPPENYC